MSHTIIPGISAKSMFVIERVPKIGNLTFVKDFEYETYEELEDLIGEASVIRQEFERAGSKLQKARLLKTYGYEMKGVKESVANIIKLLDIKSLTPVKYSDIGIDKRQMLGNLTLSMIKSSRMITNDERWFFKRTLDQLIKKDFKKESQYDASNQCCVWNTESGVDECEFVGKNDLVFNVFYEADEKLRGYLETLYETHVLPIAWMEG